MRIRASFGIPLALLCAAGLAAADGGLKVSATGGFWSERADPAALQRRGGRRRSAGRPAVGHRRSQITTPLGASVGGDYYFCQGPGRRWTAARRLSRQRRAADPPAGRVAVGLWPGSRAPSPAWPRRSAPLEPGPRRAISAMPYLGIGYSDCVAEDGLGLLGRHRPGGRRARAVRSGMGRVCRARRVSMTWCASCACRRCCSWASTTRSDACADGARRGLGCPAEREALCRINRACLQQPQPGKERP